MIYLTTFQERCFHAIIKTSEVTKGIAKFSEIYISVLQVYNNHVISPIYVYYTMQCKVTAVD